MLGGPAGAILGYEIGGYVGVTAGTALGGAVGGAIGNYLGEQYDAPGAGQLNYGALQRKFSFGYAELHVTISGEKSEGQHRPSGPY